MSEGDGPGKGDKKHLEVVPQARLRRIKGIAWRIIDEEAILVNVKRDEVIHLDDVGSFIWSKLDGETALEEIAAELVGEFEVDLETATNDTLVFATDLMEQGAVELVDLER